MFEQIINQFGLDLNKGWNIIEDMPNHHGRHAAQYHELVLSQMRVFANEAVDQADFLRMFDKFKDVLKSDDFIGMMYSAFWKGYK